MKKKDIEDMKKESLNKERKEIWKVAADQNKRKQKIECGRRGRNGLKVWGGAFFITKNNPHYKQN
jgi:hypothetical protein